MTNMVMTREQILALAKNHEVTTPEIFDDNGFTIVRGGLFDQDIFGHMTLGTIDSEAPRDLVEAGDYPDDKWGYIDLPVPVFHPSLMTRAACEDPAFSQWISQREQAGEDPTELSAGQELNKIVFYAGAIRFDTEIPTFVPAKEVNKAADWDLAWGMDALARLCGQEFVDRWCLTAIPVVPISYRKIYKVKGSEKYALSDLNDLYRYVINRSNRVRRLKELNAPPVIMMNETRLLQERIDTLFLNGAKRPPKKDPNGHELVSLAKYFTSAIRPKSSFVYAQAMCFDVTA